MRLLDRTTRGLGLTQVGQQVFEHARAAVIEAEAAEEAALRMQAEPRGLVRLSCPLGLQSAIAAPMSGFLAAHPLLRLQCIVTNRRVDLVHEGIDVAIRVRERLDTDADLQMKRIGVSRRILVASPTLLAKEGEPMTPADLGKLPILHQEQQGGDTWHLTADNGDTCSVAIEPRLASRQLRHSDSGRMPGGWNCAAAGRAMPRRARLRCAGARAAGMERHRRHRASRLCLATRHAAVCSGRDRFRRRGLEIVGRSVGRSRRSFTR